jgi:hypothetical protein
MRRFMGVLLAAALTFAASGRASGAQEIPDVPPLGFTISPSEGPTGSVVAGEVDPADIAANCITDPTEFVAQFVDPENPGGGELTPYLEATSGALQQIVPGGAPVDMANDPVEFAAWTSLFFPVGLAGDLPAMGGTGELVEGALDQTFVMAFADLATVSPVEPLGGFDRESGVGEVAVPSLPAGSHPVIATCVGLPAEITLDEMLAAIDAGAAALEANFAPPFPTSPFSPEFAEVAAQVAPAIIAELVEPRALGVQFFCVFDPATGACPTDPPPPPGPGDPGTPGGPGSGSGTPPTAQPATAVTGVQPRFTG